MLKVTNLSKSFGDVQAVKNFSFKVKKGEVLGLIGPNGAGKTTAIKCICSILQPDKGKISINGHDILKEPIEARSGLAFVPEVPNPYMYLTVEEHIKFTARIFEMNGWEKKAEEMIDAFDLDEKRKEFSKNLSKGQKQKLNLICAFLYDPTVILLDEPLYGIDPMGGRYLKDLVKNARDRGASIVVSSHMLGLVEEVADRVLVMLKGEKVAEGTLAEVKSMAHLKKDARLEDVYIELAGNGEGVSD